MISQKLPYILSDKALLDIRSFESFLSNKNEEEILSIVYGRIYDAISLLREFQDIGKYDADLDVRIFPVPKTRYNIIFQVNNNILEILRIYHTSQTGEAKL